MLDPTGGVVSGHRSPGSSGRPANCGCCANNPQSLVLKNRSRLLVGHGDHMAKIRIARFWAVSMVSTETGHP